MLAHLFSITIDVTQYDADGNDEVDDTQAFQRALNLLVSGDTLIVPRATGFFQIAWSGLTLSTSNVTLIFRGEVKWVGVTEQSGRLLSITSDSVVLMGEGGGLHGSGQYEEDDFNSFWSAEMVYLNDANNTTIEESQVYEHTCYGH